MGYTEEIDSVLSLCGGSIGGSSKGGGSFMNDSDKHGGKGIGESLVGDRRDGASQSRWNTDGSSDLSAGLLGVPQTAGKSDAARRSDDTAQIQRPQSPQGPAAPHTRHRTDAGKRPVCPNPGLLSGSTDLQAPAPSSSGGAHHSAIQVASAAGRRCPKEVQRHHFAIWPVAAPAGNGYGLQIMSHTSNIVGRLGTPIPNGSVSVVVNVMHCSPPANFTSVSSRYSGQQDT